MTTRQLGAGQPEPTPWPDAPEGWRWNRRGAPAHLIAPDGWKTHDYNLPERALAEAQRRMLSQPKPKESQMTATQTLDIEQAITALRQHGCMVRTHGARYLVALPGGDAIPMSEREVIGQAQFHAWLDGAPKPLAEQPTIEALDRTIRTGDTAALAQIADEAPLMTVAALDGLPPGSMPLVDLMTALDEHAKQLPHPLPTDHPIPLPAGIPSRLSAPLGLIRPGRYQPRTTFDETELAELAESIKAHGILNPLIVFGSERGDLELISGERRLRAAALAGLTFVPVELRSYTLRQIAEISGLDNIQRAGLTPVEEGRYFNRLIGELEISEAELARRLGKNRAYIQQRRAIATAAPEVVSALDEGAITFSQARAIAQAAPGQAAAQKQALTKLRDMAKQGKRATEEDARAAAEKVVLAKAKKDLEALGWQVSEPYGYYLIYSAADRPAQWTGTEILEAVAAGRRPSADTPAELDGSVIADLLAKLKVRYRVNLDYKPWIGLSDAYEAPTFYAASELAEQAQQAQQELAAMQARAAAAGWTLTADAGQYHTTFSFQSGQGARHSVYGWVDAMKALDGIEAGTIKAKPAPSSSYQAPTYKCDACKKTIKDYEFVDGQKLCPACTKTAKAAVAARQAQAQERVNAVVGPWLLSAPDGALRLLFSMFGWQAFEAAGIREPGNQVESVALIRTLAPAQLAGGLARLISRRFDERRENPITNLESDGTQSIVISFTAEEQALFVGQAERAIPLLQSDGYATVADFVQVARKALLPSSSPDEEPLTPDAELAGLVMQPGEIQATLDQVAGALAHIEAWAGRYPDADREEIAINLGDLIQAERMLEDLSGAEHVDDEAWERLSHTRGELEVLLRERLEQAKAVGV